MAGPKIWGSVFSTANQPKSSSNLNFHANDFAFLEPQFRLGIGMCITFVIHSQKYLETMKGLNTVESLSAEVGSVGLTKTRAFAYKCR